jgi:tetratricopeptide (TPR) repeat protein
MPPSPYDACPCGSGKKFKWCCGPYFDQVERALTLQQRGQHDAAVREMEQAAAAHPAVPQVWGYFAHLLYAEGNLERAEEVLQKAFAVQPDFAMGYFLQGLFRQAEGEVIGALLLFRKAAEAYDPAAHDQLAQVHEVIARHELLLNRPVACRAALERAAHFAPADAELKQQFEALFGADARLPLAARKPYRFRPTVKPVAAAAGGKLSDARKAFEALTAQVPGDPAGWFDLGLVRAWQGDQPGAVDALQKSVELEWDDDKAEETAALVEVLRCGQGMEGESDYLEHRAFLPVRDPQAVLQVVQEWANAGRVIAPQMDPEGQSFSCLVVEELPSLLDTGTTLARVVAGLSIAGGVLRLWHADGEGVTRIARELRDRVNLAVGEPVTGQGPAQFGDIVQDAVAYPVRTASVEEVEQKLRDRAAQYFEGQWANRPLKALAGATPLDAAGSTLLRKRLLGVIKFLSDCLDGIVPRKQEGERAVPIRVYDFDRLRHKLGAEKRPAGPAPHIDVPADPVPPPPAPTPVAPPAAAARPADFAAMSAADLAAVAPESLSPAAAEDAMRAALKLDARELAVRFARAGSGMPADPARPDRYPLFACLIAGALADGDPAAALAHAEAGLAHDSEHNAGKRFAEFGVHRGKLLAKLGRADDAAAAFDAVLEAHPAEGKFYVTATEAMLSAKQGAKAAAFAQRGLEAARRTNNRDLDGACRELAEAAKRMGG